MDYENPEQVLKALLFLHGFQTLDEQASYATRESNSVGFNMVDAGFCTSIVEWVLNGGPFTDGQFRSVSKVIRKYHGQITNLGFDPANIQLPDTWKPAERGPNARRKLTGDGLLHLENGRLIFVPNVYPSKAAKQLGFSWRSKRWEGPPLSLVVFNQFVRQFPKVVVDSEVQRAVELALEATELPEHIEASETYFPYQKDGIQFLLTHPRALLAFSPGLGKTLCASVAASYMTDKRDLTVLVVCPKSLLYTWQNEVQKWVGETPTIWHGNSTTWEEYDTWVVTNYDTMRINVDELVAEQFDLVIFDESVLLKNRKAKRVAAARQLAKSAEIVWLLSGAPTTRFYDDLWAQLNLLSTQQFRSYWRFARHYCMLETTEWGTSIIANQPDAAGRLQEDLAEIMIARTQDQVLSLPNWIIEDVELPMGKKQEKAYLEMEEFFFANLPEADDVVLAPNVLAQLLRLIQFASNPVLLGGADQSPKWDAVAEMLTFYPLPAILWVNFIATGEHLLERLSTSYKVEMLTGSTPVKKRQEIVDRFQAGELDVVIAHPAVGKFGLTLTKGRTAVYVERSFNGDDYFQSLHRIRRIGTTESPHVIHLLSRRKNGDQTVDHAINRVLSYRRDSALKLTTGVIREAWGRNGHV